ncbi:hypothetical protein BGW36DRAFT_300935 [Talaromyces proteolyticus]|uniref:Ubiquitin-like-conjugating enzyme ATG10 n=1 Tax=Talaromyces proteolyticus TaxID=1131652 RepID=A0AAD4KQQ9_9EURO|nr:uncharacterized protein BGW36DRAFT_300935 [Talaromyces proteolyticus]KAH8693527.1 hypothetical protein BGW36DRAFT_300935 [Talaromyces proteolyticus]
MVVASLSIYPFLTDAEFDCVCRAFLRRVDAAGGPEALGWLAVSYITQDKPSQAVLRISKSVTRTHRESPAVSPVTHGNAYDEAHEQEDTIQDDDQETLVRNAINDESLELTADYDITLSQTYQVPVLYFVVSGIHQSGLAAIDAVYQLLVPDQHKGPLKSSGVMGGISFGYHPQSGIPAYFIHPCNTATAMRDIAGGRGVEPENYLLIWLGLVGNCINLNLSCQLFRKSSLHDS